MKCNSNNQILVFHTLAILLFTLLFNTSSFSNDTLKIANVSNSIEVFYFHGNARCPTCFKLEKLAKSEIDSSFTNELKSGRLKWNAINVEESGNEHFGNDYQLYTKSVIISVRQNGKEVSWKNLDQIWQLVHNESKYREYIRNEIRACLNGKCL